jgi:hypothetical protein
MRPMSSLFAATTLILASAVAVAGPDWEDDPYEKALAVNEGALNFLARPPDEAAHHHVNRLSITAESLVSGWVSMDQCHYHIDPVPRAEIVYAAGRIRGLRVVASSGIGDARVQAHSVQLANIDTNAELCVRAETLGLEAEDGRYVLRNGPFMRRFLDGFYPMRVTLDVTYPVELQLVDQFPSARPGVEVRHERNRVIVDAWFEGILETRFFFQRREPL